MNLKDWRSKNIKESESKRLEILSAFSLYKKYGEIPLLNT